MGFRLLQELQEAREAQAAAAAPIVTERRRLPRGTSDYQAAWILDDGDRPANHVTWPALNLRRGCERGSPPLGAPHRAFNGIK